MFYPEIINKCGKLECTIAHAVPATGTDALEEAVGAEQVTHEILAVAVGGAGI